jgi:hypothetical protein
VSGDVGIDEWLTGLGFDEPTTRGSARAALEEAKLTRAGKQRISVDKKERAEALLKEKFFVHCSDEPCTAQASRSGRVCILTTHRDRCERCGGSANQGSAMGLVSAFRKKGFSKLVVVGGSPAVRTELERMLGGQIQLRMIDGTERRTGDRAKNDLEWADLVLVWGGSELHHKVSLLYTNSLPQFRRKVVHVPKRGIAALLAGGIEHLEKG